MSVSVPMSIAFLVRYMQNTEWYILLGTAQVEKQNGRKVGSIGVIQEGNYTGACWK